jgi:hypothetical protein
MIFKNAISWFEIPTTDINRALIFYETIFDIKMIAMDLPNIKMRLFPLENPTGVGGSLVNSGGFHKSSATDGPLIYLNANPDVQLVLDKVEAAGGKIQVPKTITSDIWPSSSTRKATASHFTQSPRENSSEKS